MASITLTKLCKSFGEIEVLINLDLSIADGEFVVLVGPSGCGKSTLLRLIAGLDDPTSGDILMDDHWVNNLTPRERNVAMVFQSYALYPHMTVAENIGFNLRISGLSKADIKQRVARAAQILDIGELLQRKPSQLSGGQRQRVAMGRALVRDPDVFLFDEPLSNLDAKLRIQMREEIKHLHQSLSATSLYVTHDQNEAMALADRIVLMNKGVIQQVGSPMEIYNNPCNEFVAGFMGSPSMNFIQCTMSSTETNRTFQLSDGSTITVSGFDTALEDGPVKVGLRPEHLSLSVDSYSENTLVGVVRQIEPTGAHNQLRVAVADNVLTVFDESMQVLSVGETVTIGVDSANIHAFALQGE